MKVSANLGFLWTELPLPEAIRAVARAGCAAVECHFPTAEARAVRAALDETGLPLLSLNTARSPAHGLATSGQGRTEVDAAIAFARTVGARGVHVIGGPGRGPDALRHYRDALVHACYAAPDLTILIEPLNPFDAPDYVLDSLDMAEEIIGSIAIPNLRLLFDCYHVGRLNRDVIASLERLFGMIGHVQVAAVPDRGQPDHGALDYPEVFDALNRLGYDGFIGAEYRPDGPSERSFGWAAGRQPSTTS